MEKTAAEILLDIAQYILHPKDSVIEAVELTGDRVRDAAVIARIDIALKFERLPVAIHFQAIVEEWPIERIKEQIWK